MNHDEPGTTQSGRVLDAFVILLPLLVAATKLLPGGLALGVAELLGGTAAATLAHVLAGLSLLRAALGARRSSAAGEWLLRRVLGERIAERFRAAPAVGDLIVNACHDLRARKDAGHGPTGRD